MLFSKPSTTGTTENFITKLKNSGDMKTSEEWNELVKDTGLVIMDPDGWDRRNFQYSFFEELITYAHFEMRLLQSTCLTIKPK